MKPWIKTTLLLMAASFLIAAKPNLGGFKPEQVCQAAIASVQGVKPHLVRQYRRDGDTMQLRLSQGGNTHSFYCELQADNVLWRRSADSVWQQSPSVGFSYNSSGKKLVIKHSLGSAQLAEFSFRGEDF
ncbi:hypothetical protein [Agarivorans sp. 1_MG-2023]|uniref:hypothetical protein n=1 Tax=Agarivorans sp. 1_MG-2023 TaxID=3062634 RepID=UPI0026E2C7A4|nr:hypothetical protein [Agarivorans sp. 1_MG-2023]MDO6763798.1 hypothetical protein [Agarivorans sp. 1_MG-2023]